MKKIGFAFLLLAMLVLPAHAAYALTGPMDGRVVIGQNFTLKSGDKLDGDLVVIGGEATVEQGANVAGNVVVIGGSLKMDGTASGDAVVIGGLVLLGEKASVTGDVVTVGGSLQRAVGAVIGGNIVTNLPPPTFQIPNPSGGETPLNPPTPRLNTVFGPFAAAAGVLFQAIGLAAIAMLLTVFLQPQLERVSQAVFTQPFMAGSIGLLTAFLAPVALVILVVTLILIPVAMGHTVAGAGALRFERTGPAIGQAGRVFGLAVARVLGALVQALARRADQFLVLAVIDEIVPAEDALRVPLPGHGCRRVRFDSGFAEASHRRAVAVGFVATQRLRLDAQT